MAPRALPLLALGAALAAGALRGTERGRAQRAEEPGGACLSAADVLTLAAATLGPLWDPMGAYDVTGSTDPGATGSSYPWLSRARARALLCAFPTAGARFSTKDSGGRARPEGAELLEAIGGGCGGERGERGCLDAGAVLAAGSPRVGAGRVLAALGALVLRGRCLCPTAPPSPPQPHGTSNGTRDGLPKALPWATMSGAPPEPSPRHGDPSPAPTANGTVGAGPRDQLSTVQRFAVASAAGLVLALAPLLALLLLRCPLAAGTWRWLRPLLLGGAAGALSGDAILHLLPQVLGLHDHGGGGAAEPEPEPLWKLLPVLGGVYGAFVLERLGGALLSPAGVREADTNLDQSTEELQSTERWVLPVMTSLGAAAHSLADGLALGAAFAGSWQAGAAAGAGLLLHELPHALGDAAVLAHAPSAAARRRALWLRVGGAAPALPGLWAGLALGGGGAGAWVQAAAAGAILYLSLADLIPALQALQDPHPWVLLGVQSLGLVLGWGALLLLALYEDSIIL